MADVTARNTRLDALLKAAQDWSNAQTSAYQHQVTVLQNILQGRKGAQGMTSSAVSATSDLVIQEINDFLLGGT
jgi:hypothetical protein